MTEGTMQRAAVSPLSHMLFFFELGLFILVMLTLALGEFVGRGAALVAWGVFTAVSAITYLAVSRLLATSSGDRSDPLVERWNRTLLYAWRRTNGLLLIGVLVVAGWYWLGRS